jgi:hypothetical protein
VPAEDSHLGVCWSGWGLGWLALGSVAVPASGLLSADVAVDCVVHNIPTQLGEL